MGRMSFPAAWLRIRTIIRGSGMVVRMPMRSVVVPGGRMRDVRRADKRRRLELVAK
jgi:hypothetical protein